MPITNDIRARADEALEQGRKAVDQVFETAQAYLEQAKGYAGAMTDRAEVLLATARKDERIARLLDSAESVSGVVLETVQERVVKPVQKLTGVGHAPGETPAEPATVSTVKPTTLPAERPTATPEAKTTAKTTPASAAAAKPATKTTAPKAPLTDA